MTNFDSVFHNNSVLSQIHGLIEDVTHLRKTNRIYALRWLYGDNPTTYDSIDSCVYDEDSFIYELNSHGFRCDEFDAITARTDNVNIVFLGCSNTFGLGTPEDETWTQYVASYIQDKTNREVNIINLGISGGSLDHYLELMPSLSLFNPDYILSLSPQRYRMILTNDDGKLETLIPSALEQRDPNSIKSYHALLANNYTFFEYRENVILNNLHNVANLLSATYINIPTSMFFDNFKIQSIHLGRDGIHYNSIPHKWIAQQFIDKLEGE